MDAKEQELYQEEQRQLTIELRDSIRELKEVLTGKIDISVAMPEEMKISGEVEVNTEKEVRITNIEQFLEGIKMLDEKLEKALTQPKTPGEQSVVVKNIDKAIAKEVKISNLSELRDIVKQFAQIVANKETVVNVTEKSIAWPTLAKDAIPVRLSDGKSFYRAVVSAFAGGGVSSTLATDIANAIGAGGISAYTYIQKDTTSDTVSYKYYGYMKADAAWVIKRVNRSSNLAEFAVGASSYTASWTGRAALSYSAYSDAF